MNAASSYFEMGELVRAEAQGFEKTRHRLDKNEALIRLFVSVPVRMLRGFVVRKIDRVSQDFAHRAVWFRGAREGIAEQGDGHSLDPDRSILKVLDEMAAHLVNVRDATVVLVQKRGTRGDPFTKSLRRVERSTQDLMGELRGFRAAFVAYEAQVGSYAGEVARSYFSKGDPTFARLCEVSDRMSDDIAKLRDGDLGDIDGELLAAASAARATTAK